MGKRSTRGSPLQGSAKLLQFVPALRRSDVLLMRLNKLHRGPDEGVDWRGSVGGFAQPEFGVVGAGGWLDGWRGDYT